VKHDDYCNSIDIIDIVKFKYFFSVFLFNTTTHGDEMKKVLLVLALLAMMLPVQASEWAIACRSDDEALSIQNGGV